MTRILRILQTMLLVLSPVLGAPAGVRDVGLRPLPLARLLAPEQTPTPPGDTAAATPKLFITIVDGDGAVNNLKARTAREPVVQVSDENHKPVAGALVTFFVPNSGAGGSFGGEQTLSVMSDARGQAVGKGFHPNTMSGQFQIEVTASFAGQIAKAIINESNVTPTGSSSAAPATHAGLLGGKMLVVLGVAAAAGTAGLVYGLTHTSGTPTATIGAPGTVTVGASH